MALGCSKHLCKLTDRMVLHLASVLVAVRGGTQTLDDRGIGCSKSLEIAQDNGLYDGAVAGGYNWEEVLYY